MKTVVTEIGAWKKRVEVEVDSEEVRPYMEEAYRSYQKKVHVDGFRKGKAPLSLIRQRFGERIRAEVADDLIQTFFQDAVQKENLSIVSPGTVQELSFEENKPFRFTAEVEVEPEVRVADYRGLKVEKEALKVTEEDVKRTLEMLREQKAEMKPVEGGAEAGHIVEGDVQVLDPTGVPIIGKKWENRSFEMGSPPLGDIVEDQLLGVRVGEERRFQIVQSEKGPDGKIKDREDHYSIKVKSVQEKILPELSDRFAREASDFQTLADLEEEIKKSLEKQREEEAERLLRSRIADKIVKRNDFEVPLSMIENGLKRLWEDYQERPDGEMSEEQFREEHRATVVWNIKRHLLWKKIAEVEGITVTEEEVDEEIEKMAKSSSKEGKRIQAWFKDSGRRRRFKENILEDKVMGFLKENARIKEVSIKKGHSPIITQ